MGRTPDDQLPRRAPLLFNGSWRPMAPMVARDPLRHNPWRPRWNHLVWSITSWASMTACGAKRSRANDGCWPEADIWFRTESAPYTLMVLRGCQERLKPAVESLA